MLHFTWIVSPAENKSSLCTQGHSFTGIHVSPASLITVPSGHTQPDTQFVLYCKIHKTKYICYIFVGKSRVKTDRSEDKGISPTALLYLDKGNPSRQNTQISYGCKCWLNTQPDEFLYPVYITERTAFVKPNRILLPISLKPSYQKTKFLFGNFSLYCIVFLLMTFHFNIQPKQNLTRQSRQSQQLGAQGFTKLKYS